MRKIFLIIIIVILFLFLINKIVLKSKNKITNESNLQEENIIEVNSKEIENQKNKITDWKLILVNYENYLPENYKIELASIDNTRIFDKRAISDLNNMILALKEANISNIWVQSAYRSYEYQKNLFNNKVNLFINQGKTKEEAESLTMQTINRPGTSEHNLGLAVDFNYVDYEFENTKAFKWLNQNAENYGFILRYKKEKEEITKVNYEPWHWRYVGIENAKEMNKLDMCLEEYVSYLEN